MRGEPFGELAAVDADGSVRPAAELDRRELPVGDPPADGALREAELRGDLGDGQKARGCVRRGHAGIVPAGRQDAQAAVKPTTFGRSSTPAFED